MGILDKVIKKLAFEESSFKPKGEKFMEMETQSGQTLVADEFEPGNEVRLKTDEGMLQVPADQYVLSDGRTLVVGENSMIEAINAAEGGGEGEGEGEGFEKMKKQFVTREEFAETMTQLDEILTRMSEMFQESKQELSKEQKKALEKLKADLKTQTKRRPLRREIEIDDDDRSEADKYHSTSKNRIRRKVGSNIAKVIMKPENQN